MMTRPAFFRLTAATRAATLALALALPSGAVLAQTGPFSPVRTVNERVITQYELDQRILFMQLLRQPGDIPAESLKGLTDDRLRSHGAEAAGVALTEDAVRAGMEEFAARANLTAEQFIEALAQGGVDAETFRDFVTSGLAWREVVRAKFGPGLVISEAAIDRSLANFVPTSALSVLMSEIVLPATGADRNSALALARRLKSELKGGGDFAVLARGNSAGPTAGNGGAVDWQRLAQLPEDAAAAVRGLAPGQVSEPVILDDKVVIYLMREMRQDQIAEQTAKVVSYAEFLIPNDGAAGAEAARVRAAKACCSHKCRAMCQALWRCWTRAKAAPPSRAAVGGCS
jgi:peptidyl-prolyl cis-trans isomerase SurA